MIAPYPLTADHIRELDSILDEEAALLVLRHSQLGSLCSAIIDRDEPAMERILHQIEQAQQLQATGDRKADALRVELAAAMGVQAQSLRLSGVIAQLPPARRAGLLAKRKRIIDLAERFRAQHLRTVVLLNECARINRLMLEALLPKCQGVTTYSAAGSNTWQGQAGLMDMES